MENRERLGSRLGFIMLSAGCAIGCGNVWKFPWMCGQNGGGSFMLIYVICLIVLGLPTMIMEFSVGRAAQTSPLYMYRKLSGGRGKWNLWGIVCLIGNIALIAFYAVVSGWILYYFVKFLTGQNQDFGFEKMITTPSVNVTYLLFTLLIAFVILSFHLQGGLERITKYMMSALIVLMLVLAVHSFTLPGAGEGLSFYLIPHFSKITGSVVVGAMNQAFFTLSVGMGGMAIFGSYIGKDRSLMGESIHIIILDTLVAVIAGIIIFPACFTYDVEVTAGPSLLFDTMATVFNNMAGGRVWGTCFFIFMSFAALSTIIAVFENIISFYMDMGGWSRKKAVVFNIVLIIALSLPAVLGFNLLSGFQPMGAGTSVMDLEDFLVSYNLLPLGSMIFVLFCVKKNGWGWDNFRKEANEGKGMKISNKLQFYMTYILPAIIVVVYLKGYYDTFAKMGPKVLAGWMAFAAALLITIFTLSSLKKKEK